jgi:hypothetical protein
MSISEFIHTYVVVNGADSEIGYLAQHQLFDQQVLELRKDIIVPDYCALLLEEDEVEHSISESAMINAFDDSNEETDVHINAWFGPPVTISPLHHDPFHNLLASVIGA